MSPQKSPLKQNIRTGGATKHNAKGTTAPANPKEKQSGIAIVTVLSVLLLMSVLILAFFSAASTELDSSRHYASSLRTRQLTDIVTNMVIAQVRKATTPETRGVRTTWSSQPGLITTFTNRGTTYEQLVASKYKLYSSANMEAQKTANLSGDFDADWQEKPAQWVDLNAPSYSKRDDRLKFPIADPRAYQNDEGENSIEGFTYVSETSSGAKVDGVVPPKSGSGDDQRMPMPVQWLYMLDDGTLGYLDDSNKFIATSGAGRPSKNNPLSARLAFWTDDESTKINVNTASEGTHWDMPRYGATQEHDFSKKQPAQREFNRYPGSPAMVSLSSVFYPHQEIDEDEAEQLVKLAPKVSWGGSKGGTVTATSATGVPIDEHRLYATVDELLYRHAGNESDPTGESPRIENEVFAGDDDARELLEKARFCLTTNSVAPEITLHGTPRVSMWPLNANPNQSTFSSFDRLIEYCTKVGGAEYYWRRQSSGSRHHEVYLRANAHNVNLLYNYIDMHSRPTIPGYGRSIAQKYGTGDSSDSFQILTMCWDYMRTTNLWDPFVQTKYGSGRGQIASCCLCGGPPAGQNGTTQHTTRWDKFGTFPAKGIGRLYSVSEVTLVFVGSAGDPNRADYKPLRAGEPAPFMEIGILIEGFSPSHGFSKILPDSYVKLNGPPKGTHRESDSEPGPFYIGDLELELNAASARNGTRSVPLSGDGARAWGGHGGPRMFTQTVIQFQTTGSDKTKYIPAPQDGSVSVRVGGPMKVIMYDSPSRGINNLIQVAELNWPPNFSVPIPKLTTGSWAGRVNGIANGANREKLISENDVTRSMVVSHGDYRHTMAKRVSEADIFQPHYKFDPADASTDHAHSLTDADGYKFNGFSVERNMIEDANYPEEFIPDFPISPDSKSFAPLAQNKGFSMDPEVTGDWDTGLAMQLDGPFAGRPDDGTSQGTDPYFDEAAIGTATNANSKTFFSPNRLVSGPGMFGSLPTGVRTNVPWRTLLFRPDPLHFGAPDQPTPGDIPDHLFMDLFWMPVVEPYAISMPFATRGKINLNYQIIPFDNIKRATALHALMKAERVLAIPTNAGGSYKTGGENEWRRKIDAYETLKQAEDRFKDNEVFRSPSEICELYLVPEGEEISDRANNDYLDMRVFWENHKLTGDNVKERPYANMYPRLTTKSNVYKVHMIVQTLKKVRSTDVNIFDPEKDKVSGQWSGSAIIERFIDPNDERIPDYRNDRNFKKPSLENFYNYRVLHVKQFTT